MVSPQVATAVGSRLGAVEDMERRRGQDTPNYFMRVRVTLPVSKPLRCGGFIANSDGERTSVKFKYERLPIFCHFCGILGHDLRHCASHYAIEKYGGRGVYYQYGDWLKAIGGQRSPPWNSTVEPNPQEWISSRDENYGEDAKNQGVEAVKCGLDSFKQEDEFKKYGINPNIQQRRNTKDKGVLDADNENPISISMDKADEILNSQSSILKAKNVGEQIGQNLHGPINLN